MDYTELEDIVPLLSEDGNTETHKKLLQVGSDRWAKAVVVFLVQRKGAGDRSVVGKVTRWVDALG